VQPTTAAAAAASAGKSDECADLSDMSSQPQDDDELDDITIEEFDRRCRIRPPPVCVLITY